MVQTITTRYHDRSSPGFMVTPAQERETSTMCLPTVAQELTLTLGGADPSVAGNYNITIPLPSGGDYTFTWTTVGGIALALEGPNLAAAINTDVVLGKLYSASAVGAVWLDAVHHPGVVPDDHVADRPVVPIDEPGLRGPLQQLAQCPPAVIVAHSQNSAGGMAEQQGLAPRAMFPDERMYLLRVGAPMRCHLRRWALVVSALQIHLRMNHALGFRPLLLFKRQVFVGGVGVGEFGPAAAIIG